QLHVVTGSAIIECGVVEKDAPIRVTNGDDTLVISKPGTYRFPEDTASASLDEWNRQRSDEIAAVTARSAETDSAAKKPAFSSPVPALYPGGAWPYTLPLGIGSVLTPFSFFGSYGGGYRFYQPLPAMPPILLYRPVIRPAPRPLPSTLVPISPRPGTP